jgi:hypothetical protein
MDYYKLFDKLGFDVDATDFLNAPKTEAYPQRNPGSVELNVAKIELQIFNGLVELYHEISSIQFTWNFKGGPSKPKLDKREEVDYVSGAINVLKLEAMLFGPEGKGWTYSIWHAAMTPEEIAKHRQFRPFDFADSRIAAGFMVENGEIKDELYLYYLADRSSEIFDMEMNFAEYMRLLHKTRGFAGWQVAWLFGNGYEYDFFMHYFPQLFPDVDISEFAARASS